MASLIEQKREDIDGNSNSNPFVCRDKSNLFNSRQIEWAEFLRLVRRYPIWKSANSESLFQSSVLMAGTMLAGATYLNLPSNLSPAIQGLTLAFLGAAGLTSIFRAASGLSVKQHNRKCVAELAKKDATVLVNGYPRKVLELVFSDQDFTIFFTHKDKVSLQILFAQDWVSPTRIINSVHRYCGSPGHNKGHIDEVFVLDIIGRAMTDIQFSTDDFKELHWILMQAKLKTVLDLRGDLLSKLKQDHPDLLHPIPASEISRLRDNDYPPLPINFISSILSGEDNFETFPSMKSLILIRSLNEQLEDLEYHFTKTPEKKWDEDLALLERNQIKSKRETRIDISNLPELDTQSPYNPESLTIPLHSIAKFIEDHHPTSERRFVSYDTEALNQFQKNVEAVRKVIRQHSDRLQKFQDAAKFNIELGLEISTIATQSHRHLQDCLNRLMELQPVHNFPSLQLVQEARDQFSSMLAEARDNIKTSKEDMQQTESVIRELQAWDDCLSEIGILRFRNMRTEDMRSEIPLLIQLARGCSLG
jgi:hypothetical protein